MYIFNEKEFYLTATYQNGWQLPDLQLLRGRFFAFAVRTMIPLLQLLLGRERAQTVVQIDRLRLLAPTNRHRLVFVPQLRQDGHAKILPIDILRHPKALLPSPWYSGSASAAPSDPNQWQCGWLQQPSAANWRARRFRHSSTKAAASLASTDLVWTWCWNWSTTSCPSAADHRCRESRSRGRTLARSRGRTRVHPRRRRVT